MLQVARATTYINESGESPNNLGIGAHLNLHFEFSFGLEFSFTGDAATFINLLENTMKNLNTTANFLFNTLCNAAENTFDLLKGTLCTCYEQVSAWAIWYGVLLLRSQVGNTPTRMGKRQVVRGGFYQEKPGRFESFPPHQMYSANNSVERDRPQAALVGSLRGFAATAAPHVKRYAYLRNFPCRAKSF